YGQAVGPVFRAEDVTTAPPAFGDFVRTLTAGKVEIEDAWVESVLRAAGVNRHTKSRRLQLAPWQREVAARVVEPEAWALYEELGYARPSFLRQPSRRS